MLKLLDNGMGPRRGRTEAGGELVSRVFQAIVRALAFTLRGTGSHCKILNKEVTQSDFLFNRVTLTAKLRLN